MNYSAYGDIPIGEETAEYEGCGVVSPGESQEIQGYHARYQVSCNSEDTGGGLEVCDFNSGAGLLRRPHAKPQTIPIGYGEQTGVVVYQDWRQVLVDEEEFLERAADYLGGLEGYMNDEELDDLELEPSEEERRERGRERLKDHLSVRHYRPDRGDKPTLSVPLPKEFEEEIEHWLDDKFGRGGGGGGGGGGGIKIGKIEDIKERIKEPVPAQRTTVK